MRRAQGIVPGLIGLMVVGGCGGGEPGAGVPETEPSARAESAPAATTTSAQVSGAVGRVTFTVDGRSLAFDHLPAGASYYTPLASALSAKPGPDSPETLTIIFMSMDLRALEYPAELPDRDRFPAMAAATIGFGYIDATGQEWAGPGRIHVESFDGSTLVARFSNVSLPHTDKARPDIVLGDGEVRAALR
jgi:hypothetical protein